MTTVNNYRIYCNTEATYVYKWDTTFPTTCPNNNAHSIDSNSIVINDSINKNITSVSNLPTTCFDEVRTVERTRLIELKSFFGKSELRDIYTTTGTAEINNVVGGDVYTLSVSGASDTALLKSAQRGRYVAGLQAEVGIGANLPNTLSGNQSIKIGLFDDTNGMYFKYTVSGLSCAVLRNSIETVIPRSNWNVDKLDGTGPSGLNLNIENGIIFKIIFSWYGYGAINFNINTIHPNTLVQKNYLVHIHNPGTQTSIRNPNLPISVELSNNGTVSSSSLNISGRQYALLGRYDPITRVNANYRIGRSINSTTTFLPIMSIRRKVGYLGNPVNALSADLLSTADLIIQVRINTTLTGGTWGDITDTNPSDTAVEVNNTATAVSGGIAIWTGIVAGDSRNTSSRGEKLSINYDLPEYSILTISAKGISNTAGLIDLAFRWTEEW